MNKLLLILLVGPAVFAVNTKELRSKTMGREWMKTHQSNIQYKKTNNLFASLLEEPHEYYASEFSTRMDHFRPRNQERVNFTYNVNSHHFENYGPLFIYLKESRDHSTRWIEEGLMVDIAEETGAALLTFNYRFLGDNRPTDNVSFENLELLSVEQILADLAVFIRAARQAIPTAEFSRVILWGSGAGASFAVLARARYPHLVYGVWSSSGIIESSNYSWGPYDVFEYTFDINDGGRCKELIIAANAEMDALIASGRGEEIAERMHQCDPFDTNSSAEIALHYESIMRTLMIYLNEFHYQGVLDYCDALGAIEGQPLDSMMQWHRSILPDYPCFNSSYSTHVARYSSIEWDQWGTNNGRRQWFFLQCTQIASFLVSDQYTWVPGTLGLDYHLQRCEDLFGRPFSLATISNAFNTLKDEFNQRTTNVIYTNGNLDPIRYFGRTNDPTNSVVVLNIDFAAKSADLLSIDDNDPNSITDAKETIISHITRWVTDEPPTEPPFTPTPEPKLQ